MATADAFLERNIRSIPLRAFVQHPPRPRRRATYYILLTTYLLLTTYYLYLGLKVGRAEVLRRPHFTINTTLDEVATNFWIGRLLSSK